MPKKLHFFHPGGRHGYLANFSEHPIVLNGRRWKTVEHYYQAQKFVHRRTIFVAIRDASTPARAKQIAKTNKALRRSDWHGLKDRIMQRALKAKFTQHPALREKLLATGDAQIIERTANDSYWGDGADGKGLNRMGNLLMLLRDDVLRTTPANSTCPPVRRP